MYIVTFLNSRLRFYFVIKAIEDLQILENVDPSHSSSRERVRRRKRSFVRHTFRRDLPGLRMAFRIGKLAHRRIGSRP